MALACDLRPLTPDEWMSADIVWRNELMDAKSAYLAVYGPEMEKHREVKAQKAKADARARETVKTGRHRG